VKQRKDKWGEGSKWGKMKVKDEKEKYRGKLKRGGKGKKYVIWVIIDVSREKVKYSFGRGEGVAVYNLWITM
jgi:hypothetical protein